MINNIFEIKRSEEINNLFCTIKILSFSVGVHKSCRSRSKLNLIMFCVLLCVHIVLYLCQNLFIKFNLLNFRINI